MSLRHCQSDETTTKVNTARVSPEPVRRERDKAVDGVNCRWPDRSVPRHRVCVLIQYRRTPIDVGISSCASL
jgi:hypothetical protein